MRGRGIAIRKLVASVLALAVAAFGTVALAACAGQGQDATPDADTSLLGGDAKFTVGYERECPPYSFARTDGALSGLDIELAQAVCDANGWELSCTPVSFDGAGDALESGEIDCFWSGVAYSSHPKGLAWSDGYASSVQVVMVKATSSIKMLADLKGKTVGAFSGSAVYDTLSDGSRAELGATFKKLKKVANVEQGCERLANGKLDAFVLDEATARFMMSADRGSSYALLDEIVGTEQFSLGFKKGDAQAGKLGDKVQATLLQLNIEGKVGELFDKYDIHHDTRWTLGKDSR